MTQDLRALCHEIAEFYYAGKRILIRASSKEQQQELDNLLWTFKDTSFVPHHIHGATDSDTSRVHLGSAGTADTDYDVCIDLQD